MVIKGMFDPVQNSDRKTVTGTTILQILYATIIKF